jgi:hypothetical protein
MYIGSRSPLRKAKVRKDCRSQLKIPEGKVRGLRWEDNIKMDIKEMGFDGVNVFMWLRIGSSGEILRTR